MSSNRHRNRDTLHIKVGPYHEIPVKVVYLETLFVIAFAIIADLSSTYFLFRDFPQEAVNGEQNKIIVGAYVNYGLPGIPAAFLRFWSGWIGVSLLGSFLIYFAIIKYLDIASVHKVGLSISLGLSMATLMNFGAGISNALLYISLIK